MRNRSEKSVFKSRYKLKTAFSSNILYIGPSVCTCIFKAKHVVNLTKVSATTFYRQLITWANIDVNSDLNPNSHSDEIMKDTF